jgi:acyl-CoA synthetase (NDP forming)
VSEGRAVAVVGASESTLWTYWLMKNLREYGYPGSIWPVNPNRQTVYGYDCFPSVEALPFRPERGVVITSAERAYQATADLAGAGVQDIVVISDGFRETATDAGRERERELVALSAEHDLRVVGPNCVGYASLHENYVGIAEPIPSGLKAGGVSVISQSGVLTHTSLAVLKDEGLGIDVCYSIGNGAVIGFERACQILVERPTTKVVCAVVESVQNRAALRAAITAGRNAGVEFVFLIVGQSEEGQRTAKSHTGAVTGDQRIMRAWLRSMGVTAVSSMEEFGRAAYLLSTVGRPSAERGIFILTSSGGGSGLAADLSASFDLPLAQIDPETKTKLKDLVLPGTVIGNPLDITSHAGPDSRRQIFDLIAGDPSVGMLLNPWGINWPDESYDYRFHRAGFDLEIEAVNAAQKPIIYASIMNQPPTDYTTRLAESGAVVIVNGLTTTLAALSRLYIRGSEPAAASSGGEAHSAVDSTVIDEAPAREILEGLGLPVVGGRLTSSPEDAAKAAAGLPAPWVVKLALSGLGHKGRVGGVRLGLCTPEEVTEASSTIADAVEQAGLAPRDEVRFMVQQMVFGAEILVGLVRDDVSGPSMIVGVGGWAAESASIFAAIPLDTDDVDVATEISRSMLPKLVGEERSAGLTALLEQLATQFTTGGLSQYQEVECNPVILTASGPVIADVMLVTADPAS